MQFMKKVFRDLAILVAIFILIIGVVFVSNFISAEEKSFNKIISQENADVDKGVKIEFISSTEYFLPKDQNGSTILKLRDNNNDFINTSCFLTILFPDRTVYLTETLMSQDFVYGEYFLNWEIPESQLGVYSQEVKCLIKNKNVSIAKSFHVSNITNILLASDNSLNGTLKAILDSEACQNPEFTTQCDYLRDINGTISSLNATIILSANQSVATITEILTTINETTGQLAKIYFEVSAPSCIIGSQWLFEANVTNEEYEILRFLDCTLSSSRFGIQNVPFDTSRNKYRIVNNCDNPEDIVTWNFTCLRIN